MPGGIERKWRPALWLVLLTTAGMILGLPLAGIVAVRYLWPVMGYQQAVWAVGFAVLFASVSIAIALWRILLRPIEGLADRAERIKLGDSRALAPLPHYGTVEMQRLGQSMLDMGRVLQGREAVLRSYADHVTHELRSPLTVMRGAAELLADDTLSAADRTRLLQRIDQAAGRMTALLEAQRALARAQEPFAAGQCRIGPLVPSLTRDLPNLRVIVDPDGDLPLPAEAISLVLGHLFGNAAAHGAQEVTVSVTAEGFRVSDNGPGISDGNRDRIFDPFFTTRREAGGTGMGLPIVRRMLEAHGAEIRLVQGPGATFEIRF